MSPQSLRFYTICKQNGVQINDKQLALFEKYAHLLLGWNKQINLISRKDEEHLWENHFLHSVSLLFRVKLPKDGRILDLGTGGGLPGIPIKIVHPELPITLMDATQKKTEAVKSILSDLGYDDVPVLWERAEDLGKSKEHHRGYEVVIARAVAPLHDLVKWSHPFLQESEKSIQVSSGSTRAPEQIPAPALIAFKGGDLDGELASLGRLKNIRQTKLVDLVFHGSENVTLTNKKLVIVSFR